MYNVNKIESGHTLSDPTTFELLNNNCDEHIKCLHVFNTKVNIGEIAFLRLIKAVKPIALLSDEYHP